MFNVPGYVGVPFSAASGNLLDQATQVLGGITPQHYWDFTKNRALFSGVDVGPVTSTPNWSFTRASSGYAQTAEGTLVNFGSNVPRLTNKGLLIEEARTNLLLQSQTLATTPWTSFQSSISADATAAPDGTTTADKLVEDTATNTHTRAQTVTLTASVQTFSIYAKAAERTQFLLFVPSTAFADATSRSVYFNLTGSGSTSTPSGSGATASIEALANGWYRCILNVPATLAIGALIQYGLSIANVNNYTGNGTSGLFFWGAQIEASTVHSSYIPTTTAAATRQADVPSVSSPSVNYPMTIHSQFNRTIGAFPTNTVAFTVSDGTQNNRITNIVLATTSQLNPLVASAGVTQYGPSLAPALVANVTTKLATRAGASSANSARDAVLDTATGAISLPATPTLISMGMNSSFTGQLNGYLLRAAIFNFAATDAQLQAITR